MTKVFQIIIVAIALTSTAYSQTVRSSFFTMNQVKTDSKSKVGAYTPAEMLVVNSFSDRYETFTFVKNSKIFLSSSHKSKAINTFVN